MLLESVIPKAGSLVRIISYPQHRHLTCQHILYRMKCWDLSTLWKRRSALRESEEASQCPQTQPVGGASGLSSFWLWRLIWRHCLSLCLSAACYRRRRESRTPSTAMESASGPAAKASATTSDSFSSRTSTHSAFSPL